MVYPITTGVNRHILSWDGGNSVNGLNHGIVQDGSTQNYVTINWKRNTTNGWQAFRNGVLIDGRNSADVAIPDLSGTPSLQLGAFRDGLENMDGILGHVTIQNEIKSQDRITTEFNNQDAPGTFYAISTTENVVDAAIDIMGYET